VIRRPEYVRHRDRDERRFINAPRGRYTGVRGKQLTVNDNVAYVPSLLYAIRRTAAKVRGRSVPPCSFPGMAPEVIFELLERDKTAFREHYWFLQWDEIVDNVSKYAYLDRGSLVLMFAFPGPAHPTLEDRGSIFVATIQVDSLRALAH
jgi:hypothetical protein